MKKNMGSADKIIRTLIAVVIGILIITGQLTGIWAIVLGIFAVIFLATSLFGFCPLYLPFNLSTTKKSK
jgi:hypothetical protein